MLPHFHLIHTFMKNKHVGLEEAGEGGDGEGNAESWYDREAAGSLFPQLPLDSYDIHQPPDWKC